VLDQEHPALWEFTSLGWRKLLERLPENRVLDQQIQRTDRPSLSLPLHEGRGCFPSPSMKGEG